jgi:hypothetical protein
MTETISAMPWAKPPGWNARSQVAAPEGERKRQRGGDQRFDQAHACLGDVIVGRLFVRGERDATGELGGHRVAVPRDVPDLAGREPQPRGGGERERGEENQTEPVH